ncbi:hypothetical protein MBLNU230_g4917t1 [Neophaeotheca triangularis]
MDLSTWYYPLLERVIPTPTPPPRVRTSPMAVLCVGLPRSGTESLQVALQRLGYPTYHGWDILFEEPTRYRAWSNLCRKKWYGVDAASASAGEREFTAEADFDPLIGHVEAVCDAPANAFAMELIAAYPRARVVLNVRRDLGDWHRSARVNLVERVNESWGVYVCTFFSPALWWGWHLYERWLWWHVFRCVGSGMRTGIVGNGVRVYKEHCAMVRGLVPKENLLEWSVEDGWEPLCKFLGKPVPKEPFPRVNDAAGFDGRVRAIMANHLTIAVCNMAWVSAVLVSAGVYLWRSGTLDRLVERLLHSVW